MGTGSSCLLNCTVAENDGVVRQGQLVEPPAHPAPANPRRVRGSIGTGSATHTSSAGPTTSSGSASPSAAGSPVAGSPASPHPPASSPATACSGFDAPNTIVDQHDLIDEKGFSSGTDMQSHPSSTVGGKSPLVFPTATGAADLCSVVSSGTSPSLAKALVESNDQLVWNDGTPTCSCQQNNHFYGQPALALQKHNKQPTSRRRQSKLTSISSNDTQQSKTINSSETSSSSPSNAMEPSSISVASGCDLCGGGNPTATAKATSPEPPSSSSPNTSHKRQPANENTDVCITTAKHSAALDSDNSQQKLSMEWDVSEAASAAAAVGNGTQQPQPAPTKRERGKKFNSVRAEVDALGQQVDDEKPTVENGATTTDYEPPMVMMTLPERPQPESDSQNSHQTLKVDASIISVNFSLHSISSTDASLSTHNPQQQQHQAVVGNHMSKILNLVGRNSGRRSFSGGGGGGNATKDSNRDFTIGSSDSSCRDFSGSNNNGWHHDQLVLMSTGIKPPLASSPTTTTTAGSSNVMSPMSPPFVAHCDGTEESAATSNTGTSCDTIEMFVAPGSSTDTGGSSSAPMVPLHPPAGHTANPRRLGSAGRGLRDAFSPSPRTPTSPTSGPASLSTNVSVSEGILMKLSSSSTGAEEATLTFVGRSLEKPGSGLCQVPAQRLSVEGNTNTELEFAAPATSAKQAQPPRQAPSTNSGAGSPLSSARLRRAVEMSMEEPTTAENLSRVSSPTHIVTFPTLEFGSFTPSSTAGNAGGAAGSMTGSGTQTQTLMAFSVGGSSNGSTDSWRRAGTRRRLLPGGRSNTSNHGSGVALKQGMSPMRPTSTIMNTSASQQQSLQRPRGLNFSLSNSTGNGSEAVTTLVGPKGGHLPITVQSTPPSSQTHHPHAGGSAGALGKFSLTSVSMSGTVDDNSVEVLDYLLGSGRQHLQQLNSGASSNSVTSPAGTVGRVQQQQPASAVAVRHGESTSVVIPLGFCAPEALTTTYQLQAPPGPRPQAKQPTTTTSGVSVADAKTAMDQCKVLNANALKENKDEEDSDVDEEDNEEERNSAPNNWALPTPVVRPRKLLPSSSDSNGNKSKPVRKMPGTKEDSLDYEALMEAEAHTRQFEFDQKYSEQDFLRVAPRSILAGGCGEDDVSGPPSASPSPSSKKVVLFA